MFKRTIHATKSSDALGTSMAALGLVIAWVDSYLTNRFHVAVRLFSNRSQMTSKCGKNKKVAHEA